MMANVLQINDLQVCHDNETFLDVPDIKVRKGRSVAILGGNGAGKTTLLETILGLKKHSLGSILWAEPKENWGIQLQNSAYNKDYKVCEIIRLHGKLYQRTCPKMFVDFAISSLMHKKLGVLSRGEKQRVDLYLAMAHLPKILVLDEPGTGLDKTYYHAMVQHINQLRMDKECTIVMASHSSFELSLATDIVWMENGKIKKYLPKDEFIERYLGQRKVVMKFHDPSDLDEAVKIVNKAEPLLLIQNNATELLLYGSVAMAKVALEYSLEKNLACFVVSDIEDSDIFEFICSNRDKVIQGDL